MKFFFHLNLFFLFSILKYIYSDPCYEYSCEKCSSDAYGSCTKCRDGFHLVDGTCPCSDFRCALCPTGFYDSSICQLCKKGYYNYNNRCYCDIDGCAVCENNNKCLVCYDGYILNLENKCDVQDEENNNCFDPNCHICLSEVQGTCEECNPGYNLTKGECNPYPSPNSDGNCETGYYKEDSVCKLICDGLDCTKNYIKDSSTLIRSACNENECLACQENELRIIPSCNNSEFCTKEGCAICVNDDECDSCRQGYYLLGGVCKRCINGCSMCNNDLTCQYCLSGYELTSDKKCVFNFNKVDFNINLYQKKKFELMRVNYPDDFNANDAAQYSSIEECDSHCTKCDENSLTCKECDTLYELVDTNKCNMSCSDDNCIKCSIPYITEQCDQCKEGYVINGKNCYLKCSDENCRFCSLVENQEVCTECLGQYKSDGVKCKLGTNYMAIIYSILVFLILAIFIICFCWYKQKKIQERQEIMRMRIAQGMASGNLNNVEIYNRSMEEASSQRIPMSKELILDEFEKQKLKIEKGAQMCMFCKKKPGKYKCDCECVVCKEHSQLKKEEGDGESYKVCFNCGKVVKKVTPIKEQCNICFEKKISLVHFKCDCALLVCKDCYLKCKLESDKCPGCRAKI